MRQAVVADIEETTRSIRNALQDAERMAGVQVLKQQSPLVAVGSLATVIGAQLGVASGVIAPGWWPGCS